MTIEANASQRLGRVFHEGFVVKDIVEPMASFDATTPAEGVRAFVAERGFKVIAVRNEGRITGYTKFEELGDGLCGDSICAIEPDQVLPDTAPLAEVVLKLERYERVFVSWLGEIGGIVTRTDMQKPPRSGFVFVALPVAFSLSQACRPKQILPRFRRHRIARLVDEIASRST